MKETIEGMKRRRSMAPRPSLSPRKFNSRTEDIGFSLLAPGVKEELASTIQLASVGEGDVGESAENEIVLDEEGAIHDDDQTPRYPSQHVLPAAVDTPRMDDLRHVFGHSKVAATPSFEHLLSQPGAKLPDTPVFEGIGEMLGTPAPYRQSGSAPEHDIQENDEANDEPTIAKRAGRRTRSAAMNTPSIDKEPDDEKPKHKTRVPRGGKKATEKQKQVWMIHRRFLGTMLTEHSSQNHWIRLAGPVQWRGTLHRLSKR
jgi:hypothetical protein